MALRVNAAGKRILQKMGEDAQNLFLGMMHLFSRQRLFQDSSRQRLPLQEAKDHPYIVQARAQISAVDPGFISTNDKNASDEKQSLHTGCFTSSALQEKNDKNKPSTVNLDQAIKSDYTVNSSVEESLDKLQQLSLGGE